VRFTTVNRRDVLRGRGALGALLLAVALCGCQRPVLPADQPRTQFDRFDRVRNQTTPQYVEDEFGRRRPNIGGRLSPK